MKKTYYVVSLEHGKVGFKELVDKTRTNLTKMTGNPLFPEPTPKLEDLKAVTDRLDSAIQAYDFTRSRLDKQDRDGAFAELKELRHDLGSYVQAISKGELSVISSAGFTPRAEPQPVGKLPAPHNVRAVATRFPGIVELRYGGVKHRLAYRISICAGEPSVESNWEVYGLTGKVQMVIEGLESGKTYYFRVEALGVAGFSPVSDVAWAKAA